MAKQLLEAGTLTENNDISIRDSYKKCELLKVIQHIDIYGKIKSSYTENRRRGVHDAPAAVSSVSCCCPRFPRHAPLGVEERLSKLSVTTKVSGLYPGNEILAKKTRHQRLQQIPTRTNTNVFGSMTKYATLAPL